VFISEGKQNLALAPTASLSDNCVWIYINNIYLDPLIDLA